MKPIRQNTQADCTVEFLVIDPKTKKPSWTVYETMTIQAPTVEHLMERAHMYIGRPERHDNVSAIRLTGRMAIMKQKKDAFFQHEDSITLDLHILRERSVPLSVDDRLASGQ
ncbi:hypothetical protein [Metabacillus sp. SLBN-84]